MNDSATLLQACERQEALYQFDRFTREDALKLGLKLHENALKYPQGVAIEITVNGLSVFRYVPEGACLNNIKWLERKARTVTQFEMSSLRTWKSTARTMSRRNSTRTIMRSAAAASR